jgi:capsular exopolysaccharide synthesis family protein
VLFIGTTLTTLYVLSRPKVYQATATLRLKPKEYTIVFDGRAQIFQTYDEASNAKTQIRLINNPQLIRSAILRRNLQNDPRLLDSSDEGLAVALRRLLNRRSNSSSKPPVSVARDSVDFDVENPSAERVAQLEPYVQAILANLSVEQQENTDLITIRYTHGNPDLAFAVADSIARVFIERDNTFEDSGRQAGLTEIAKQVAEIQTGLKTDERKRLDYLNNHDLPLAVGQGRNLTAERLGTLSAQLLAAENETKNLASLIASLHSDATPEVILKFTDTKDLEDVQKTIRDLQRKRAALLTVYTRAWPEVQQVDAQLKQQQATLEGAADQAANILKLKLDTAVAREHELRAAYEHEQAAANHQTRDEVELTALNQGIETNKQIYNVLFQRQREMEINASSKSQRVSLANPATVPISPIALRFRPILTGFLISLIVGLSATFLFHQFDTTLKSAEDVTDFVRLPTLASIPALDYRFSNTIAQAHDLQSPAAEAYRQLRTSLIFNLGLNPHTILITSGRPLEGKTTTAISLAITIAQTGATVALVDCDLRRPQLHNHLGLNNTKGFSEYVYDGASIDDVLQSYPSQPSLSIVVSGKAPSNPADCLQSNAARELIDSLRERFEYVIVDSPPAMGFADATILSTIVDAVLIVIHVKRNSRFVIRKTNDRLSAAGATVCGVVLNNIIQEEHVYYSRYYQRENAA